MLQTRTHSPPTLPLFTLSSPLARQGRVIITSPGGTEFGCCWGKQEGASKKTGDNITSYTPPRVRNIASAYARSAAVRVLRSRVNSLFSLFCFLALLALVAKQSESGRLHTPSRHTPSIRESFSPYGAGIAFSFYFKLLRFSYVATAEEALSWFFIFFFF